MGTFPVEAVARLEGKIAVCHNCGMMISGDGILVRLCPIRVNGPKKVYAYVRTEDTNHMFLCLACEPIASPFLK